MWPRKAALVSSIACAVTVQAFDAGHIPTNSWLTGHGYRHGDIDDILSTWMPQQPNATGKWSFQAGDSNRIYFGNWERDYSQMIDMKSLSILSVPTLVDIIALVGFLEFGYGTSEFPITSDTLGTYLPVQHIDNPDGYGDGKDPQQYDPRLRPPVQPIELVIDPTSGMKNYIRNTQGNWDTSYAWVQRTVQTAVDIGREAMQTGNQTLRLEAYRYLGAALHTMEDFMAHSNFLELTLVNLGYTDVFPFVGNQTQIEAPSGKAVYPLVTGTFGASDMAHSILGELADYLSQESETALEQKIALATSKQQMKQGTNAQKIGTLDNIQSIVNNITTQAKTKAINAEAAASGLTKRRLQEQVWKAEEAHEIVERDLSSIVNSIENGAASAISTGIAELTAFKDKVEATVLDGAKEAIDDVVEVKDKFDDLMTNLDVFVLKALEPLLTPFIEVATQDIYKVMDTLIDDSNSQWEVFNDTMSTNPTHSLLSKDHFRIILNEPAGQIAQMITINTVSIVTGLWEDASADVDAAVAQICEAIFHPDFIDSSSEIQQRMVSFVSNWIGGMDKATQTETLRRLTKDGVSNMENVRFEFTETQAKSALQAAKAQFKQNVVSPDALFGGDSHMGLDSPSSNATNFGKRSWDGMIELNS